MNSNFYRDAYEYIEKRVLADRESGERLPTRADIALESGINHSYVLAALEQLKVEKRIYSLRGGWRSGYYKS